MSRPGRPTRAGALTDTAFWDAYWQRREIPAEVKRGESLYIDAILDVFDRNLPRNGSLTALEIGGAPGQYLAYLHRTFGYRVAILDNSPVGCAVARENFELLSIDADVHEGDMFSLDIDLPQFDVVYSLGLIEHFTDLDSVVEAHLQFLRPGGTLALGCPNFRGINRKLLERVRPSELETTASGAMRLERWQDFERSFGLELVFRGYVGGFEPGLFTVRERAGVGAYTLWTAARVLRKVLNNGVTRPARALNSALWSGYVMGVYRIPLSDRSS